MTKTERSEPVKWNLSGIVLICHPHPLTKITTAEYTVNQFIYMATLITVSLEIPYLQC